MENRNPQSSTTPYDYTLIALGGAGVGKSTVLNFMLDGEDSGSFQSSKTAASGLTKKISYKDGPVLGKGQKIRLYDVPGLTDLKLPIEDWAQQFKENLQGREIDMALIVTKENDYRMSLAETMSAEILKNFFSQVSVNAVFLVYTHCDGKPLPEEERIQDKLARYEEYTDVKIPRENVIFFDKTSQSLEPLVQNFTQGHMIGNDVDSSIQKFSQKFQGVISSVDQRQGSNLKQEYDFLVKQLLKEQELRHKKELQIEEEKVRNMELMVKSNNEKNALEKQKAQLELQVKSAQLEAHYQRARADEKRGGSCGIF